METQETNTSSFMCPYLTNCKLLSDQSSKMPELVGRIKLNFCTNENADCARRRISDALGVNMVPPLMLPDQRRWAEQFIKEYEPVQSPNVHDCQNRVCEPSR